MHQVMQVGASYCTAWAPGASSNMGVRHASKHRSGCWAMVQPMLTLGRKVLNPSTSCLWPLNRSLTLRMTPEVSMLRKHGQINQYL